MVKAKFKFGGYTAEQLKEKIQPAIDKFDLKAEYEEGAVWIIGPEPVIQGLINEYQKQQVLSGIKSKLGFSINF